VNKFYLKGPLYAPLRWAINYFIDYIEKKVREIENRLEEIIENITTKRFERKVKAEELIQALSGVKCIR